MQNLNSLTKHKIQKVEESFIDPQRNLQNVQKRCQGFDPHCNPIIVQFTPLGCCITVSGLSHQLDTCCAESELSTRARVEMGQQRKKSRDSIFAKRSPTMWQFTPSPETLLSEFPDQYLTKLVVHLAVLVPNLKCFPSGESQMH